jgi:hypothetical protein
MATTTMLKCDAIHQLVIYIVEVGAVDMFSAPTAAPLQMLKSCMAILLAHWVALPSLESDFKLRGDVVVQRKG